MNYQYRYGTSTTQAFKKLWTEGGLRRLYRGVGPALLQGPLSRYTGSIFQVYRDHFPGIQGPLSRYTGSKFQVYRVHFPCVQGPLSRYTVFKF